MSRAELDLPVLASPEQIRRREFVTTRRGYDQDQVRDYLDHVASQVERMQDMLREARREAENAAARSSVASGDPYEQFAARLGGLIRAAEEAARIRREARDEAERVLREARADADRIRLDAQSKAEEARESAEQALREAREAADRTIAGLDLRRNALMEQLASMQERLLTAARELGSAIERHETVNLTEVEAGAESVAVPGREHRTEEGSARAEPQPPATSVDEPRDDGAGRERDPARRTVEDLWSETDAVDLTIPDIPPLDLGWGDEDE